MKGTRSVILALLVLALVLGGAYALYGKLSPGVGREELAVEEREEPGTSADQEAAKTPAPDFTVEDAAGDPVKLSDHLGKPMVLNFWASWCGPCKSEMPEFDQVYAQMGEEVTFLMVNMTTGRETLESAKAYVAEQAFSFPVFYDTAGEAAAAYGVQSLPTTYFIDEEGNLAAWANSAISREILERGIAIAMGEES